MQTAMTPAKIVFFPEPKTCSSRVLDCFGLNQGEYFLLRRLGQPDALGGIRSTPQQRGCLLALESKRCVRFSERHKSFVLSELGETFLKAIEAMLGAEVKAGPAKVLQFPTA